MRTPSRATSAVLATSIGLSLVLPGTSLAQDPASVTYETGTAQVTSSGGVAFFRLLELASGKLDRVAGTLTLTYRPAEGKGSLTVITPPYAGTFAGEPKPPRGAAIVYRRLEGLSGERGTCTISWVDLPGGIVSGSFGCPDERRSSGRKGRYSLAGAFVASASAAPSAEPSANPDAAASAGPAEVARLPVYPLGVAVDASGQRVTPLASTDVETICLAGKVKKRRPCDKGETPVSGSFRVVSLEVCAGAQQVQPVEPEGYSRALFGGTVDAPMSLGVPGRVPDAAIAVPSFEGLTVTSEACMKGHVIAGTRGPLVVWTPPDGGPAVGWTLDEAELPPTAAGPVGPGQTTPPATGGPVEPSVTSLATGFADLFHDAAVTVSPGDLVLSEGSIIVDGAGTRVHLVFSGPSGETLTIGLPGVDGQYEIVAGEPAADRSISYVLPEVTVAPGVAGCQVAVVPTEAGGVQGNYSCNLSGGGTASGSFIANP